MTRTEQYNAILDRSGFTSDTLQPLHISFTMIMDYMDKLKKLAL